ncbi:unnamed protein product [Arabidopsis arenosa]|uniref:MYB transcription factor n=1 Tax=Arabidopsis arenosa TaxID=38785 RepID=A0A8S2B6R3_ARAAE|nr:unnamed protein product [Arabidopsis arenosa]
MESTFQAFKRPSSNDFGENNALVRGMHHEKQEKKFWTPSEDLKLTELVATYGARRWNRLAEKMQGRTGRSCRIRWLNKVDPRINKTAFTDEEDAKILSAQRELGNQWTKIAKLLHRRTDIARPSSNDFGENNALVRGMHHERYKKKYWTPSEDLKLTRLVATYGPRRWNHIAEKMQVKTGKSCRFRWINQLDPRINKTAFNDEEEAKILSAQRELGNKWSKIAKLLHRRTANAVKNHWHQLMRKTLKKQTKEETNNLKPSSSLPSEGKDTMEASYFKTNVPLKYIDFLGVGDA